MRAVLLVVVFCLIGIEPTTAEVDAWNPGTVHADWQTVSRLQRVPLFDKNFEDSRDLPELLQHETPIVRLAAATAIVQSKQELLYDHVLDLCRDDWAFVAEKSLELLMRANDKRRNQRLIKAGSFPDWQLRYRKPYSKIYHAISLPTEFTPTSYWDWHDKMRKLRADARAGRKIERSKRDSLFGLSAGKSIGSLDRSIEQPGDKIIYRIRRHRHSGFDYRIRGFDGALELGVFQSAFDSPWHTWIDGPPAIEDEGKYYGQLQQRWPRMRRIRQQLLGELVEEDYEIILSPECRPGDYCLGWQNYHACFRVVRSPEDHDRAATLVGGTVHELVQSVVNLRSPQAIKRVAKLLDEIPLDERRSPDANGISASGYWELLGLIGTKGAAAKLLNEKSYMGQCMERSPRSALAKIGFVACEPALDVLRDWKNQNSETLELALSVVGPNAIRTETELLKEIISHTTERIQLVYPRVVKVRTEIETQAENNDQQVDESGYPISLKEFSRSSEEYARHLDILNTALSKLRANEREFVLETLLKFSSEPRVLTKLIPDGFVRADPTWATNQLWEKSGTHPEGEKIGKATALGFARARVTSSYWIRSLDFPITSEGDLIWFRRSVRPELRSQLDRRVKEYEAIRKPPSGGVYLGE